MEVNFNEVVKRLTKYLVEGLAVAVVAYSIPKRKLNGQEVLMITLTAGASFAVLDMVSPSVSDGSRLGAGFAMGASLVGGL